MNDKLKQMTIDQILKNLHLYQKWRRGGKVQPDPKEIGEALDETIRLLRKIKKGGKP